MTRKKINRRRALIGITAFFLLVFFVISALPRLIAWQVWWKHEAAIIGILNKESVSADEFGDAIIFFSAVTGIKARADHTYVGYVPTEHTKEDLELWRKWYEMNRLKLYWDYIFHEVTVKN